VPGTRYRGVQPGNLTREALVCFSGAGLWRRYLASRASPQHSVAEQLVRVRAGLLSAQPCTRDALAYLAHFVERITLRLCAGADDPATERYRCERALASRPPAAAWLEHHPGTRWTVQSWTCRCESIVVYVR
jgi:hypothetical protein